MLAGSPRALRPSFATRLTSPAVMAADEPSLAVPLQIPFAAGSAHLTASATHLLDHLGQALTAGPLAADRLRIEGHADANGAADANNDIAERRALAVAAYLEQNFAVSPARLACVGQGTSPPRQRVVLISRLASG
jgi:outer membrane protein OmpA-like peptidoglycan-associated protein